MFGGTETNVQTPKRARAREGEREGYLDADQEEKYNDIIELLMIGGYFRARIAGLSRFDKVVGGIAWCITAANEDLDIDVFFQEEASMGQRIKLGENIIRALKRMNCPYRLESHQIQGGANTSDFVNIFPIIQWLVKKVIEVREETGDLMRLYSESQFNKEYKLPEDAKFEQSKTGAFNFVTTISNKYKNSRKFKKKGRRVRYLNQRSSEETVQSVLMEYGEVYGAKKISTTEKSQIAKDLERTLGKKEEEQNKREEELKKEMEEYVSKGIDRGALEELLPDLEALENQYAYSQDGLEQSQKKFGLKIHEQNVNRFEKEIAQLKNELSEMKGKYQEIADQLQQVQEIYNKKATFTQRIIDEIAKLDQLETPENTQILQALKTLVSLNENLKAQETAFKANCKRQLVFLDKQIADLKAELDARMKGTAEDELSVTLKTDTEKLKKARQLAAKRNRDIALIERKIDEVPARTELTQYQRMFVELYEQVGSKLVETRRYYNTYNTLEDHRSFLEKEISILNSITDTFKVAMSSKSGKEKFSESMTTIINSVIQNVQKMEKKLNDEKERKNQLTEQHSQLIEKERLYFKATKEFLEECKKNEQLQQKLQEN